MRFTNLSLETELFFTLDGVHQKNTRHKTKENNKEFENSKKTAKNTTQHNVTIHDLFTCIITFTLANMLHVA